MHELIDFGVGGMRPKKEVKGFTLYTSLSWPGKVLLGRPGKAFDRDLLKICPSLELGSVALLIDIMDGSLLSAIADHGELDFPYPGESTMLMILTADPMLYTAQQLRSIARAFELGREPEGLSEVALANATHFVQHLRQMKIGRRPAGVVASLV